MKKTTFLMLFAMAAASMSLATTPGSVTISTCDPGENGYASVSEVHDDETNSHTLSCWEPGNKPCKWVTKPSGFSIDEAESEIQENIRSGILSGTFYLGHETVGFEYNTETRCLEYEISN